MSLVYEIIVGTALIDTCFVDRVGFARVSVPEVNVRGVREQSRNRDTAPGRQKFEERNTRTRTAVHYTFPSTYIFLCVPHSLLYETFLT